MRLIILSVEYEIFGNGSGDVRRHVIDPTGRMARLCQQYHAPLTVFFEAEEYAAFVQHAGQLKKDLGYDPAALMRQQVISLIQNGHDVQLHLHPEWRGARYEAGKWLLQPGKKTVDALFETQAEVTDYIATRKRMIEEMAAEANLSRKVRAFRDETSQRGLSAPKRWSTGCAFLDYDRDGYLDLFVAHYLDFDPAAVAKPGDQNSCTWKGFPVVCGPIGLPPETMSLYHNDGHGHFTEVTDRAGLKNAKAAGLTVLTGDFDNDGWEDVYVTGDSTASLHFANKHDGTFAEVGASTGLAYNEDGHEQSGMGASAADYDGDGLLDIVKTNFTGDIPNLYRNLGHGYFADTTVAAGLASNPQYVGWGCGFLDFDNDGWKDIFIVNGHVYPDIDHRGVGQMFRQPRLLYWNRGDKVFYDMAEEAGPGILARHSSRGIAVGDLDNDGNLEIVVVNMHEAPSLLKNYGPTGNALLIRALTASGRDAIGARLSLTTGGRTQIDEVRSGGYYLSQGDFRVHFGMGAETQADLGVRWPDGKTEVFRGLSAGTWVTVREGSGIVRMQKLARKSQ